MCVVQGLCQGILLLLRHKIKCDQEDLKSLLAVSALTSPR